MRRGEERIGDDSGEKERKGKTMQRRARARHGNAKTAQDNAKTEKGQAREEKIEKDRAAGQQSSSVRLYITWWVL